MSLDRTQDQSHHAFDQAADLSRRADQPPAELAGYQLDKCLGSGAYGEVWAGTDLKTRRRVAVKFFTRSSARDASLMSKEVEKLLYLSTDRYVVQLLDVGWDAKPPYYVMDFIENGSLEDALIHRGSFQLDAALDLFYEIATGLMHLHNRGILHCDLKPGNVLLDQEDKPRLADFGQSRLAHEESPALGTMFYMAPEQAKLDAVPDVRWDVYALGAVMYSMLTGEPPYRTGDTIESIESGVDVADRLARYRATIAASERPTKHRIIKGVDRALADIVDRCLSVAPDQRFESIQSVIQALELRERSRARRPILILGIVGPLLLLLIMTLFGLGFYNQAVYETDQNLRAMAYESNGWAAQFAATSAGERIDTYFQSLDQIAKDESFLAALQQFHSDPLTPSMLEQLSDPRDNQNSGLQPVRDQFVSLESRQALQSFMEGVLVANDMPRAASWFTCNEQGTQIAGAFAAQSVVQTIGKNYRFRTYFHGGSQDLELQPGEQSNAANDLLPDHIESSHVSAIFASQANGAWKVAFSVPIYIDGQFRGIIGTTVEMGGFIQFENRESQFAMLVDGRQGIYQGAILEHPLFMSFLANDQSLPERFGYYRIDLEGIDDKNAVFHDPLASDELGNRFDRQWIAAKRPVLRRRPLSNGGYELLDTGLLVIALEDADTVVQPAHALGGKMIRLGVWAIVVIGSVSIALWFVVVGMQRRTRLRTTGAVGTQEDPTPFHHAPTVAKTPTYTE